MGRKAGSLIRCTCTRCGGAETRRGCTSGFLCLNCEPNPIAHSVQYQAHKAVADAIRAGELKRPADYPCADCGKPAIEYDHRDYDRPLVVTPVCRACNLTPQASQSAITPICSPSQPSIYQE
jgi:hypothetical protein